MKKAFTLLRLIPLVFLTSYSAFSQNRFWRDISESDIGINQSQRSISPKQYRILGLDTVNLISALLTAPKEFTSPAKNNPLILDLPMPDGGSNRFKIVETSIMEPALAAKFSNIKTYGGQGIDDPYATIKIDWSALGFHAMILSPSKGAIFIDPYSKGILTKYISYAKKDLTPQLLIEKNYKINKDNFKKSAAGLRTEAIQCVGGTLRRYRLAVACTWEYAVAVGGRNVTPAQALSAIVATVNRVNGVYETEVDIRMTLINNNDKIVFTDSAKQPFRGNNNANILIHESQKVIDSIIGSRNYDIGHTFSTGAGGLASVGVVCDDAQKANGVTGSENPVGDPYDIDFVAHEMGHEFGATHTFNAATDNCSGNGEDTTNVEPGSGSTIMAYAGICGAANNLQANSIPYFHAISFDQITNFSINGNGNSCAVKIPTGNRPPVVNAGTDHVIPKSTPFVLTGSATDPDRDPITYSWEEINVGGPFGDWNNPLGDAPIFRSFPPATTPQRYFPKTTDIINNTTTIGEILPGYARTLNFRLTARDNRAGSGGVCSDEMNVTVDGRSGPFLVTFPNKDTTWTAGTFQTITWDVANTTAAPVNCAQVAIELSTDGGLTFPVTLANSTPNDGLEEIVVPNNVTTKARVRVRAIGNVFFDISNSNFTIKASAGSGFDLSSPQPVVSCSNNANAGTIIKTNGINGFTTPISLSASGNPVGTTVAFSANPITPGSIDSISIQGNIPPGLYNINLKGTAGSVVKTRVIEFTIGTPVNAPLNNTPANNSTGNSLLPTFTWQKMQNAKGYKLEISTSSTFASIIQSIDSISGTSYTLTTPLFDNTEYYWRVSAKNACGFGPASNGFLFKTSAIVCGDTVYSKNVPITIDTVKSTITSTLNIPVGGVIQDVNVVNLQGKHSYVSDLTISLVSPQNTEVILFSNACDSTHDFNISFDDQASPDEILCPLTQGKTVKPQQSLDAFNNQNSTGTWQLKVMDEYDMDGGSLDNWGLRICTFQSTALPVSWLTFTASKNGNNSMLLQWSSTNEQNNDHYEVERSADGIKFYKIGKINAGNNPAALQQYLFNDLNPLSGENFYRLKQVDKDGKYDFSKIVRVIAEQNSFKYVVYPNPAVDKSIIRILSEIKQLTLRLADASGKVLYKKDVGSVKAGDEFEIPVKGLSKGIYILTLTTEKGTWNEKVMVQQK